MILFKLCLLLLITKINGLERHITKSKFENEDIECLFDRTLILDVTKIRVSFFDFRNNHSSVHLIKNTFEKITNYQHWDPKRWITIFLPSFRSNPKGIACQWIKESFNNVPDKYLIIIDYSKYSKKLNARGVEKAIPFGYYIASTVTEFLIGLYEAKTAAKSIHLIGHGFGGHLVGFIGEIFKNKTDSLIGRITSIDPVKVCFDDDTEAEHIKKGNADYTEIYHCSKKGSDKTLGDVDVFYNNKDKQPGCYDGVKIGTMKNLTADWCSHYYCLKLWTDTVTEPDKYSCCVKPAFIGGMCHGERAGIAGYHNNGNIKGIMYASTIERRVNDEL